VATGHTSPGPESLLGTKKTQQCHKHLLQYNTFASKRPQVRTWGAKLASFPKRHRTSLRFCTSRLSSQSGEICLQKYLPVSGKLSITSYLKQNAVDYRSHLTMENNLKVEKGILFLKQAQLSLLQKTNVWGTRRDKFAKKLESDYAGTLL